MIVAECDADHVSVFSPLGERLRSFGMRGCGEGEFKDPSGIAIDGQGNILVTDRDNYCIQKFTSDGHFLKAVGGKGRKVLPFNHPHGIAYSASNNKVYVTDFSNHLIQVLSSDLTPFSQFGKRGSGKGHFDYPCGVATDSTGKVYVSDSGTSKSKSSWEKRSC